MYNKTARQLFKLALAWDTFKNRRKTIPLNETGSKTDTLKQSLGFTLVEMMIVVGLIAAFTAMGLGTGKDTNDRVVFFRDQAKVVQAIYQAREFAMATKGSYCGYGIQIQNTTTSVSIVRVLRDTNNVCYTGTDASPNVLFSQIDTIPEKIISLDTQIFVPSQSGQLTFLFMAPFNGQAVLPSSASPCFILTSPKGFASSTIRINNLGQPQVSATPCD